MTDSTEPSAFEIHNIIKARARNSAIIYHSSDREVVKARVLLDRELARKLATLVYALPDHDPIRSTMEDVLGVISEPAHFRKFGSVKDVPMTPAQRRVLIGVVHISD